jgi:hypothetical protein
MRAVYKVVNKITGWIYVGETMDITHRYRNYNNYPKNNIHWVSRNVKYSLITYGRENHYMEKMQEISSDLDFETASTILESLEKTFIQSYLKQGFTLLNCNFVPENKKFTAPHFNEKPLHGKLQTIKFNPLKSIDEKSKIGYQKRKLPVIVKKWSGEWIGEFDTVRAASNHLKISIRQLYTYLNKTIQYPPVNIEYVDPSRRRRKGWNVGKCDKKGVIQLDKITNEILDEFDSLKEAGRKTGVNNYNISNACNGRLVTAGGFKWKFKNQDNNG